MRIAGIILVVVGVLCLIFLLGASLYQDYRFNRDCGDYLKLAADAPTVERADEFLGKAIAFIEKTGRTSGNSAIIFKKPTDDMGTWYGQLKGSKETTEKILAKGDAATQLERDNALMKIRETVLDQGKDGESVTTPSWISLVPHQASYILGCLFFIVLAALGVFLGEKSDW
jgi:hypothetical protein